MHYIAYCLFFNIICILCIFGNSWCTEQGTSGHSVSEEIQHHTGSHLSLLLSLDWIYWIYRTLGSDEPFFMAICTKKLQQSNLQGIVFILQPGISDGAFQLKINNIWFCKVLLLFSIDKKTDAGMKTHECAYVSVLEEYKGSSRLSHSLHILHFLYICHILHIMHIMHLTLFDCWEIRKRDIRLEPIATRGW